MSSDNDTVTVLGEKKDGSRVVLGTIPTPPAIKRQLIAEDYFTTTREDTEGESCLMALNDYHEWLIEQGWKAPEIQITPNSGV